MAQLRQNEEAFAARRTAVFIVGPESASRFADYFEQNKLSFIGLPDPKHRVLKLYGQEVNLFKLGRMPAQVLIDKSSTVRFVHYGNSMADIPPAEELLALIDRLEASERQNV